MKTTLRILATIFAVPAVILFIPACAFSQRSEGAPFKRILDDALTNAPSLIKDIWAK
ncbi:hypothetical protein [Pseudoduganella lutea]|uniref:hypothetical protein n=1 Tax=Pseudoduganella lutea TaxID=321985 RepID=UPI0013EE6818|nr:hypothetical protein [Pseudoduganella lutea]